MKIKTFCFAGFLLFSINCLSMTVDRMKVFAECQVAASIVSADWQIKGDYTQTKYWEKYASNVFSKYVNEVSALDSRGRKIWIQAHDETSKSLINQYMIVGNSQKQYALSVLKSQDCSALVS